MYIYCFRLLSHIRIVVPYTFAFKASSSGNTESESVKLTSLQFLQETQDRNSEAIMEIYSYKHYVECKLSNVCNRLAKILSSQYPGEILSEPIGTDKAATTIGDVIVELPCFIDTVMVLPYLRYRSCYYAIRTLAIYAKGTKDETMLQLHPDGHFYPNVSFFEKYTTDRTFTFLINGTYYLYVNYLILLRLSHPFMCTITLKNP